ncbi:hypothetical protein pb186bvf_003157 [Paramecium bursaria]
MVIILLFDYIRTLLDLFVPQQDNQNVYSKFTNKGG